MSSLHWTSPTPCCTWHHHNQSLWYLPSTFPSLFLNHYCFLLLSFITWVHVCMHSGAVIILVQCVMWYKCVRMGDIIVFLSIFVETLARATTVPGVQCCTQYSEDSDSEHMKSLASTHSPTLPLVFFTVSTTQKASSTIFFTHSTCFSHYRPCLDGLSRLFVVVEGL